jgi:hypothetical protein
LEPVTEGKNRIMLFDIVEFRTADGEALAIPVPRGSGTGVVANAVEV